MIGLKIFDILLKEDGPFNSKQIASRTGADETLVYRLLRYSAAHGYMDEIDIDLFKANEMTGAFATPKSVAGFKFMYVVLCIPWKLAAKISVRWNDT